MSSGKPSRRNFIKTTAAVAGVASLGGLTPSKVLGANDKINFGVIGVGGMGTGHLRQLTEHATEWNAQVPVVCDVYRRRLTRAIGICNGEGVIDYRKVIDNKDIDAVLIATPDHWHSKMCIDAMEAGKHVYCEKPMTLTVEQAIEVRNCVKRTNKVFQVGPQYTSEDQYWNAHKLITEGKVGKVTWAEGSYNRNFKGGAFNIWFKIDESAGPGYPGDDFIDWDMWLGHKWGLAPRIPWNPEHFFRFRKYFQYNGGVATDLLYHILAPLQIAIAGENGAYPRRVTANGGLYIYKDDGRDIPDVFSMSVEYPGDYMIRLSSVLTNDTQQPNRIYAQYATLDLSHHGSPILTGNGDYKQEFRDNFRGYDEVTLHSERQNGDHSMMKANFINAIRNGEKLYCNVDLGCSTMVAIKMGVEAYRQQKTMKWDAANEKVIS
ncbi:MAG: Gfo/Idh/MocA family oxidoreductase [Candidatus Latescibacteria bacterium]|nr:Gfo/Idh/MocA family oxidoreductase [Candidatus Latescibacterota bacterium]